MSGYDAWLERPYVEAAEQSDAYVAWAEANGLDPEDDLVVESYEKYLANEYDEGPDPDDARDDWLESRWED